MQDRNLIEASQYWFTSKLDEIDTKVNEKVKVGDEEVKPEPIAMYMRLKDLETEYFGEEITTQQQFLKELKKDG